MRGVPEELVFLLIFGFVWLVQFLRRQRRRPAPPAADAERKAEAEADARAEAAAAAWAEAQTGPAPRAPAFTPNLAEGPRRAPVRRDRPAPTPASSERQTARRYSRSALMGDRRAVQDAVVVAAILQPCRARRPYGAE